MNAKPYIWIGLTIGGYLGSYVPTWFGADLLSGWSIFGSLVGSLLGVWVGYKVAERLG